MMKSITVCLYQVGGSGLHSLHVISRVGLGRSLATDSVRVGANILSRLRRGSAGYKNADRMDFWFSKEIFTAGKENMLME